LSWLYASINKKVLPEKKASNKDEKSKKLKEINEKLNFRERKNEGYYQAFRQINSLTRIQNQWGCRDGSL